MASPKVPSERTLANRKARVVYNKAAVDAIHAGMADALILMGQEIIGAISDPSTGAPRDPEAAAARGEPMMADTGKFVVYGLGKKVGGDEGGTGKPRSMKVPKDQVVLGVWLSSRLAHLVELGTVKMNARPFLVPAVNRAAPGAERAVIPAIGRRVKGVR